MSLMEDNNWEDQRSSMFDAWRRKEDIKQKNCNHQWNTVEPIYCLKCSFKKINVK